jgi:hypothetical protein
LQIGDYRRYWLARFMAVFATMSMVVLLGYQLYEVARVTTTAMSVAEAARSSWACWALRSSFRCPVLTPVAGLLPTGLTGAMSPPLPTGSMAVWRCSGGADLGRSAQLPILFALAAPMARRGCSSARR